MTLLFNACPKSKYDFNPHSHTGSDLCTGRGILPLPRISIHTPTQGVTVLQKQMYLRDKDFNPHSHTGSDQRQTKRRIKLWHFNPHSHTGSDRRQQEIIDKAKAISIHTPTQGVTIFLDWVNCSNINFNPHSHTGSD